MSMSHSHPVIALVFIMMIFMLMPPPMEAGGCGCPPLWTSFGHHCYRFIASNNISWVDAESYCRGFTVPCGEGEGYQIGHLTSVHSQEEMDFLAVLYESLRYKKLEFQVRVWIGLHDRQTENTWVWSDHTPLDFTYWGVNQPNDHLLEGEHDCGSFMIEWDYGWNDIKCQSRIDVTSFICRIPQW